MSVESYLRRMTPESLWPAARSEADATRAFGDLMDMEAPVLRWYSNQRCPMDDMLAAWVTLRLITMEQAGATSAARAEETARLLAEYRASDTEPSGEELSEMRAAFGPGVTVVNIITGRTTEL